MIKLRDKAKMLPMHSIFTALQAGQVYNVELDSFFVESEEDRADNLVFIFKSLTMPYYPLCFSVRMDERTDHTFSRLVKELNISGEGSTYDLSVLERCHEFYLRLDEYNGQIVVSEMCFFDDRGCIEDGNRSIFKSEIVDVIVGGKKASSLSGIEYDKEELEENEVELVYFNPYLSEKNGILPFFDGSEILNTPIDILRKLNILKDNGKYDLRPLMDLYYVEDIYYDGELCETSLIDLY